MLSGFVTKVYQLRINLLPKINFAVSSIEFCKALFDESQILGKISTEKYVAFCSRLECVVLAHPRLIFGRSTYSAHPRYCLWQWTHLPSSRGIRSKSHCV